MKTIVLLLSLCSSLLPLLCHGQDFESVKQTYPRMKPKFETSERFTKMDFSYLSKIERNNLSISSPITPDWYCTFDTEEDFLQFTTIDVNTDAWPAPNFTWGIWDYLFRNGNSPYGDDYPCQCIGYTNSEDYDGDDWLITPGLNLQQGVTYSLKFRIRVHRESQKERLEIRYGTGTTVLDMNHSLMSATDFFNTEYQEMIFSLTPSQSGVYYIGFHALSNTNSMILYLDDISVTKAASAFKDWTCSFDTEDDFAQFTTVDVNSDAWPASYFTWGIWDYLFKNGNSPYGDDYPNQCVGYTNSEDYDGDDWLITPILPLESGSTYELKFRLRVHRAKNIERLEVMYGNKPTVEAMTNIIMPATDFSNEAWIDIVKTISPETSSDYYIGFHALSSTNSMILYIDDISVRKNMAGMPPAAVNDLKLTSDQTGALSATISFSAPSLATDNTILNTDLGVKISSDNNLIADCKNIKPGAPANILITENISNPGIYTFTIQPYNEFGNGTKSAISGWIGLDTPQKPSKVTIKPNESNIDVKWNKSIAEHGGVLFTNDIKYDLFSMKGNTSSLQLLKTVTGDTLTTININPIEGEQKKLQIAVRASNKTGTSDYTIGNPIIVGKIYDVPFLETFPKTGNQYSFWGSEGTGFGFENNYSGVTFSSAQDINGDNGSADIQTYYEDSVALVSGKISLKNAHSPVLTFNQKTFCEKGQIHVFIITPNEEVINIGQEDLLTYKEVGIWAVRQYDLSPYRNYDFVRVGIAFNQKNVYYKTQSLYIDNFFIGDMEECNFNVSLYIPEKIRKGKPSTIRFMINNYGKTINNYSVILKAGDEILYNESVSKPLNNLSCDSYNMEFTPKPLCQTGFMDISVTVKTETEEGVIEKIASEQCKIIESHGSKPQDLKATVNAEGNVILTWLNCKPATSSTETFEDYNQWSIDESIGEWSFIDADGGLNYGYFDDRALYYENEKLPFAYIVWNPTNYGGEDITIDNPTVKPYSGTQSLASLYSYHLNTQTRELTPLDADNWLISPELTGKSQTISFQVNNHGPLHTENYEVLYSTTGKEQTDFILLEDKTISSGLWEHVSFNLPEGSKYFAIRHSTKVIVSPSGIGYSSEPYLFLVDDITFSSLGNILSGYNIYRNGELIKSTTSTEYTDEIEDNESKTYAYSVTALFADGSESEPISTTIDITTTGIDSISITPDTKMTIYTIDGKKLENKQLKDLYPGFYIINNKKCLIK